MRFIENLRMAIRSLLAQKLRTLLTMLGIIIGTGAVIGLVSVGQGAQVSIASQIQGLGSDLIFVFPGNFTTAMTSRVLSRDTLTLKDAEALADPAQTSMVAGVAPKVNVAGFLVNQGTSVSQRIVGTTPDFVSVNNRLVEFGAFFTKTELDNSTRVVVLGALTARTLYGDAQSAVGQTLRINRLPFVVVGVFKEVGGIDYLGPRDNAAVIPITTLIRVFKSNYSSSDGSNRVDIIDVSAINAQSIDAAILDIQTILRERHRIKIGADDDFTVASQKDILGILTQITDILTTFLSVIAGISLLVGGIGIMNIMLVSVTERTREIGIRKAVGAKKSDILMQFLVESVLLSFTGGALGIGFGWLISVVINQIAGSTFHSVLTISAVAMSFGFSVLVGLFFGIYPASQAASLNPIDALRFE
ncbi:MAG: ABC transporter permease [Anaerolineae bacterium]